MDMQTFSFQYNMGNGNLILAQIINDKKHQHLIYTMLLLLKIFGRCETIPIYNLLGNNSNTSDHMNIRPSTLTTGNVSSLYSIRVVYWGRKLSGFRRYNAKKCVRSNES